MYPKFFQLRPSTLPTQTTNFKDRLPKKHLLAPHSPPSYQGLFDIQILCRLTYASNMNPIKSPIEVSSYNAPDPPSDFESQHSSSRPEEGKPMRPIGPSAAHRLLHTIPAIPGGVVIHTQSQVPADRVQRKPKPSLTRNISFSSREVNGSH